MKIIKSATLTVHEATRAQFARIGYDLTLGEVPFQVDSEDPRWADAIELLRASATFIKTETQFSQSDLRSAAYLDMYATGHTGYPQPEDNFGYMDATYDLSNYCKKCAIGAVQKAPFRFKRSPVWGAKKILQLYWVYDQFFVKPSTWEELFKPIGVGHRPVELASGAPLDDVVQLDIQSSASLDLDGFEFEDCAVCGRRRYLPNYAGYVPKPKSADAPLFYSSEYFGSGFLAFRLILVSDAFYRTILELGLKGVGFKACMP